MKMRFLRSTLAVVAFSLAGSVNALTISHSASLAETATNWSNSLLLPLFDSTLGTLNSVSLVYGGTSHSNIRVENLDAAPAIGLVANVSTTLMFGGPIGDNFSFLSTQTQTLSEYDGVIDFGGTSGFSALGLVNSDSRTLTLLSGLGGFIGVGNFNIDVAASGFSVVGGGVDYISLFDNKASASVRITYDYSAVTAVPEPATAPLIGAGLLAAAAFRRRKQSNV